jgi:transmembrane sensor
MDYSNFDIADFAADRFFVSWVLSPDEHSDIFWNQWNADHPHKSKVIYEARLLVLLMNSRRLKTSDERKESMWESIQSRAFAEETTGQQDTKRQEGFRMQKHWMKFAAAFFAVAISLSVYYSNLFSSGLTIVENRKGEKSILYLPDGTKVWLNAESRISYPESFENTAVREVALQGEAFFDVMENKEKPFIVKTSQLQVKVLGTSFNVRSYENQQTIETTLVHGSVMIELNEKASAVRTEEPILLKENERAIYSTVSKKMSLQAVKAESETSWRVGKLTFVNKPFYEIEEELERWYGVEIHLEEESSASCRFSTTIENEPINKILELFKTTSGIAYEMDDKTIVIKGKLCSSSSTTNE